MAQYQVGTSRSSENRVFGDLAKAIEWAEKVAGKQIYVARQMRFPTVRIIDLDDTRTSDEKSRDLPLPTVAKWSDGKRVK